MQSDILPLASEQPDMIAERTQRSATLLCCPESYESSTDKALLYIMQVASHAQKYFIRLNSMNKKDKRRSSIHDITSVNTSSGDMTGQLHSFFVLYTHSSIVPP